MSCRPIGIFDSGLGGLTAVKQLSKILPHENIIYFGDTGRVPYGNRSKETITKYALQDARFLLEYDVKMIIAACGTASSVAVDLEAQLPVLYTGVVAPTAFAAAYSTKNKRIGVLGTSATINSHSYSQQLKRRDNTLTVFEQSCPLFVPMVENGVIQEDDDIVRLIVEKYLKNVKQQEVDTVVLGCTHYPLLKKSISLYMGNGVTLIDSGKETAVYASKLLLENHLLNTEGRPGDRSFFVSDTPDGFSEIAGRFLGENIEHQVAQINIEDF